MPGQREMQRGVALGLYPDPNTERRLQMDERRVKVAEDRETRSAGNDDLRTRLDELRFLNDDVKARAAASAEERVLNDSINATKRLSGILATTKEFPMELKKIVAEFPRSLADKAFQEQHDWNIGIHKEWSSQQAALDKAENERKDARRLEVEAAAAAKKDAADLGLKVGGITAKSGGVTTSYDAAKEAPPADPLKLATQIRGQMTALASQDAANEKVIADIEKGKPEWMKSTGLFTDEKGVKRFGYDGKFGTQPKATPVQEAQYQQYQKAIGARSVNAPKLAELNQTLDATLSGVTNPAAPAAPKTAGASGDIKSKTEYDALESGSEFIWNGKRGKKP